MFLGLFGRVNGQRKKFKMVRILVFEWRKNEVNCVDKVLMEGRKIWKCVGRLFMASLKVKMVTLG